MQAGTSVRIFWMTGHTISDWDQVCIRAIELFGLPGDKFVTHLTSEYMDFIFKDEKDAVLFELACG